MDQRQFHQSRQPRAIAVARLAKRDEGASRFRLAMAAVSLLALAEAALLAHKFIALQF